MFGTECDVGMRRFGFLVSLSYFGNWVLGKCLAFKVSIQLLQTKG